MKHIHTFESFVNEALRADMGQGSRTAYRKLKHKVYTLAELESISKSRGVEIPKELYDSVKKSADSKGISTDRIVFSTETDHRDTGFLGLSGVVKWYGELRDKKTGETYYYWDIKESEELLDESIVSEGVLVEPSKYVRVHGKQPKGFGMWAFEINGITMMTPKAMNYTDAQKWAKEEGEKQKVSTVYTLG